MDEEKEESEYVEFKVKAKISKETHDWFFEESKKYLEKIKEVWKKNEEGKI